VGDFTIPLRAALIARFSADAGLLALIKADGGVPRIWDSVPPEEVFPYIRLGDDSFSDYGDKSEPGQENYSNFHIFDRNPKSGYRGQKNVNLIQARLYALLHEKQMDVEGGQAYLIRFSSQRVLTDDGLMWHGISRYRFLIS